jgi:NAD(P)-dependent dehydrogenase (short-subunit alcohol dehydrogenase family)
MEALPPSKRFVLISGSSTGIGKACALHLSKSGFTAIAGVRRDQDAKKLELEGGPNVRPILLDIADSDSISAAAAKITEITAEDGLAGIVNNAGIGVHGPVEFLSRDDWRRQFEVNLFGHAAVTASLLPLVRRHVAKYGDGAGRIIFIGSIAGRVALPILAPYTASKHAVVALASALRMELRKQHIHVCLIEPGAIESEIWRKGDEFAADIPKDGLVRDLYGPLIDAIVRTSRESAASAIPADRVSRLVYRCLTAPRPPRRRTVGRDAFFAATLKKILPESWFEAILAKALKI